MKTTPAEKKYAIERVTQICHQKTIVAKGKYVTPKKKLIAEEKYQLISKGKVKLFPETHSNMSRLEYVDLVDAFDFSAYESDEIESDKYQPVVEKINALKQSACDQIMLGDSQEAMRIIQELSDMKI